eukprot:6066210-Prymnesium_polylepis.1
MAPASALATAAPASAPALASAPVLPEAFPTAVPAPASGSAPAPAPVAAADLSSTDKFHPCAKCKVTMSSPGVGSQQVFNHTLTYESGEDSPAVDGAAVHAPVAPLQSHGRTKAQVRASAIARGGAFGRVSASLSAKKKAEEEARAEEEKTEEESNNDDSNDDGDDSDDDSDEDGVGDGPPRAWKPIRASEKPATTTKVKVTKTGKPPSVPPVWPQPKTRPCIEKKAVSKASWCESCDCMLDNEKGETVRSDNIGCDYCDKWFCWSCAGIDCENDLPDTWACNHCTFAKKRKIHKRRK